MASSTTRNGIEKPDLNDYKNTWHTMLNENWDIVDKALDGSVTKSATASLTTTDDEVNEHISRLIIYTGSSTGTITLGGVEKLYFVRNTGSGQCTLTNGGTTVTIGPGMDAAVYTDGTDCYVLSMQQYWRPLSTQTTTSGTVKTFTMSTILSYRYTQLKFVFNGVSHSGAGNADLRIGIGTSPGAYFTLGTFGASATVYGDLETSGFRTDTAGGSNVGGSFRGAVADLSGEDVAASATAACIPYRVSNLAAPPAVKIDFNGETFDAGAIVLYGR